MTLVVVYVDTESSRRGSLRCPSLVEATYRIPALYHETHVAGRAQIEGRCTTADAVGRLKHQTPPRSTALVTKGSVGKLPPIFFVEGSLLYNHTAERKNMTEYDFKEIATKIPIMLAVYGGH